MADVGQKLSEGIHLMILLNRLSSEYDAAVTAMRILQDDQFEKLSSLGSSTKEISKSPVGCTTETQADAKRLDPTVAGLSRQEKEGKFVHVSRIS